MSLESRRAASVTAPSFSALKAASTAYTRKTGGSVIDFSIGSSNIPPSDSLKQVLADASLDDDVYQYNLGPSAQMLSTIQDWYQERYGCSLAENEIAVLKGSQEALSHLPLAFLNPEDVLLIPDPHYPIYSTACQIAGCESYGMPLKKENGYLPDFEAIPADILERAKMILISYPNNPTGATAPDSFYEEMIAFAKKHSLLIVHDNAYSELIFSGKPGRSFLSFEGAKEIGIELNSLSKSYSFGGARFAVMAGNAEMIAAYTRLMDMMDFGGFGAVGKAAIHALKNEKQFPSQVCQEYRRRRDYLIDAFGQAGWNIEPSQGTMFVWAPIPENWKDSMQFTYDLLDQTGILVHPGTNFGHEGERYVRLALVRSDEEVDEAAARLKSSGFFMPDPGSCPAE